METYLNAQIKNGGVYRIKGMYSLYKERKQEQRDQLVALYVGVSNRLIIRLSSLKWFTWSLPDNMAVNTVLYCSVDCCEIETARQKSTLFNRI